MKLYRYYFDKISSLILLSLLIGLLSCNVPGSGQIQALVVTGGHEFLNILGGRYYLQPTINSKNKLLSSTYKHNTDFTIKTTKKKHPVTKGISEFKVLGEGYNNIEIFPSVNPILSNSHPDCEKIAGWTHYYEKSRIVYIQPGHDNNAYSNIYYRKLVKQAIEWTSHNN